MGGGAVTGTLYGVGVGPGDPELMTLRAHRLIAGAPVIAYPAADDGPSFARSIAAGAIAPGAIEIAMRMPMQVERLGAQQVYDAAAGQIAGHLAAGRDVVVLCEGDPFFYGSFMYLYARLRGVAPVVVVPGVSSLGAAAAALGQPLVARNEVLTVIPGPLDDAEMAARIGAADTVAILKVGRHLPRLRALIAGLGLTDRAGYVERASLAEQRVRPLVEAPEVAPYFSMIVITKGMDPWLT